MPVYFDEKSKTWFCKFYYTDYNGEKRQKKKRGFKLQREAKAWERTFLEKQQGSPDMSFRSLYDLYMSDMSARLRKSTIQGKEYLCNTKILPYFEKLPINSIKPSDVRKWQSSLLSSVNSNGQPYSPTYIKSINNQLVAILNYAVKFYGLPENPCHKAGSIGKKSAEQMNFWTFQEFKNFISAIEDRPQSHAAFMTLYYTGIRIGELRALTPKDIDFNLQTLSINKSYQRLQGKDIITEPKTPKSRRLITIPPLLCDELKQYIDKIYDMRDTERLFPLTKSFLTREMERYSKLSGVKRIRLHDIRHSHASLLIELGFSPLLVADRLGHEKVETTLNIYGHLYPHKQAEVAQKLQDLK